MGSLDRASTWKQPIRITIDSHIVDLIAATAGVLEAIARAAKARRLIFVTPHIIRDQLSATRDPARRHLLLNAYDALPTESVPTHGFVLDVSVLGEEAGEGARLGDGGESGVSLFEVKTGGRGGMQDALLATTASGVADVLVTEDQDLCKKVEASSARCALWSFDELVAFVNREGELE